MFNGKKLRTGRRARGFTFLEVMVVVAILVLLATIIIVRYGKSVDQAKIDKTTIQLKEIEKALELYKIDNGNYPTQEQGLKALVEKPEDEPVPKKWKKSFDEIPKDPWNNDFIYVIPGEHKDFDLFSKGPNGTEGDEDDIVNWKKEEDKDQK
ncbi:MAG: type II secretion system major pseudopilin GspG [Firmicutes bacterium]|nr:type II secretion system major pseudopilin GspG [Bacillota bacterium]